MGRQNLILQKLAEQEKSSKAAVEAVLSRDEIVNNGNIHEAIAAEARKTDRFITAEYIKEHVMQKHRAALASIKQGKTGAELKAFGFSESIIENAKNQHARDVVDESSDDIRNEPDLGIKSDKREKILNVIKANRKEDGSLVDNPFTDDAHKDALYMSGDSDDEIVATERLIKILQALNPELRDTLNAKKNEYQNSLAKVDAESKAIINDLYGSSGSINTNISDEDAQKKLSVIIKKFKDKDLSADSVTLTIENKIVLRDTFGDSDAVGTAIKKIFEELHKISSTTPTNSAAQYKSIVRLNPDEVFGQHGITDDLKQALNTLFDSSSATLSIPVTSDTEYNNRKTLKETVVNADVLAQVLKEITEDARDTNTIKSLIETYRSITAEQAVEHYLPGTTVVVPVASSIDMLGFVEIDAIQLLLSRKTASEIAKVFGLILTDVKNTGADLPEDAALTALLRMKLIEGALAKYFVTDSDIKDLVNSLVKDDVTVRDLQKTDLTPKIQTALKTMLTTETVGEVSDKIENILKYVYPSSAIDTQEVILTAMVESILREKGIQEANINVITKVIKEFKDKDLSANSVDLTTANKIILKDEFGDSEAVKTAIGKIFEQLCKGSGSTPAWVTNSMVEYKNIVRLNLDEVLGQHDAAVTKDGILTQALKTLIDSDIKLDIPPTPAKGEYANRKILKETEVSLDILAQILKEISEDIKDLNEIKTLLNNYRTITAQQAVEHYLAGAADETEIVAAISEFVAADGSLEDLSNVNLKDVQIDAIQNRMFNGADVNKIINIFGTIIVDVANKEASLPEKTASMAFLKRQLIERALGKHGINDADIKTLVNTLVKDDVTVRDLQKTDLTPKIQTALKTMLTTETVGEVSDKIENILKYVYPSSAIDTQGIILTAMVENILTNKGIATDNILSLVSIIKNNFINENGELIDPKNVTFDSEVQDQLREISTSSLPGAKAKDLDAILEAIDPQAKDGGSRAFDSNQYKDFFKATIYSESDLANNKATAEQFCISNAAKLPDAKINNIAKINHSIMWQSPIIKWLDLLIDKSSQLSTDALLVEQSSITDFAKKVQNALSNFPQKILCLKGEARYEGITLEGKREPFYLIGKRYSTSCENLRDYNIKDDLIFMGTFVANMRGYKDILTNVMKQETDKIKTLIDCKKLNNEPITWTLDTNNNFNDVQAMLSENDKLCPDTSRGEFCPDSIETYISLVGSNVTCTEI